MSDHRRGTTPPDYSRMNLAELEDARNWIDEKQFPERVVEIEKWIVTRVREGDRSDIQDDLPDHSERLLPIRSLPSSHLTKALSDFVSAAVGTILALRVIPPDTANYPYVKAVILLVAVGLVIHGAHHFYLFFKR